MDNLDYRRLLSNALISLAYGYIYAILFVLCHGVLAYVTGNTTILVIGLATINTFDIYNQLPIILAVLCCLVGCAVSRKYILTVPPAVSANRYNISRRLILGQLAMMLALALIVLVVTDWQRLTELIMLITTLTLSLAMGFQTNNPNNRLFDITYNNHAFTINLQQIAAETGEFIYDWISNQEHSPRHRQQLTKIAVILATLLLFISGIAIGTKITEYYQYKALLGLAPVFLAAYAVIKVAMVDEGER